jgi:acyl-CoA reductase-like NAD-dependent aldehyde dehydrogenase
MNKVLGYIAKGKEEGATLVLGGNRVDRKGYFIEPTIFTGVEDHMTIAKEEIFGPVMSVLKFSDTDEVIRRANDTQYGLTASVFTSSMSTAQKVATGVKAGFMNVNTYFAIGACVPFGGMKQSGTGRELSDEGLKNFLEPKTVVYDFN